MTNTNRALIIVFLFIFAGSGCAGCRNGCNNAMSNTFGGAWLIVQYNMNGEVLFFWELKDGVVANEQHSDGIYFTSNGGGMVHLSGHYIYVQSPSSQDRKQLLEDKMPKSKS